MKGFDDYISKIFFQFPLRNMLYRSKLYGIKQVFVLPINKKHTLLLVSVFIVPKVIVGLARELKRWFVMTH